MCVSQQRHPDISRVAPAAPQVVATKPAKRDRVRKLRFSTEEPKVEYGLTLDEYTDAELSLCWFAPFEYAQIKANNKILIKMHKAGTYPEDHQYCYRGLTSKTSEGNRERRATRFQAALDVLREQNRQKVSGINDPEEIRSIYHQATIDCSRRAIDLGRSDAECASAILDGDKDVTALMNAADAFAVVKNLTPTKSNKTLIVPAASTRNSTMKLNPLISRTTAVHSTTRGLSSIVVS